MPVTVRRAREEDVETIARFALALFAQHHAYDPERFAELGSIEGAVRYYGSRIDANEAAVLVAELEGSVIGFAFLEFEAIDYAMLLENAAWLHDLYIDEAARGTGAGMLLVEAAAEAARELGAGKLVLTVAAKNEFAHEFFRHSGFRETMIEMTRNLA